MPRGKTDADESEAPESAEEKSAKKPARSASKKANAGVQGERAKRATSSVDAASGVKGKGKAASKAAAKKGKAAAKIAKAPAEPDEEFAPTWGGVKGEPKAEKPPKATKVAKGKTAKAAKGKAKGKKGEDDAAEIPEDDDHSSKPGKSNGKSLVIVESPAKAKTIGKYLGRGFIVKASVGHVVDLPPSKLGVDVEDDFKPTYEVMKGKVTVMKEIVAAANKAEKIFLAPDPDREGEAIAWHIAQAVKKSGRPVSRVVFNEITKKAVNEAFKHPRGLDKDLFESQQARRILDRLVGYQISPLLWLKVRRGLSAGRVQSVAVRLVVEREREIKKFVPVEYWSVTARLAGRLDRNRLPEFDAKLWRINGEKVDLANAADSKAVVEEIRKSELKVVDVQKRERRRNAPAPFTTSKLQQEASRKLRYSPKRTMGIAQSLYEGVELGEAGPTGLITYMRTDSVRVSDDAIGEVRHVIEERYGKGVLPEGPNVFKTKKSAQDAHEAVRPTSASLDPESVRQYLDKDQFALYQLIWNRFVASQMIPAVYDTVTADISAGPHVLRANGSILKEPGFLTVYQEAKEDDIAPTAPGEEAAPDDEERRLPPLEVGDALDLQNITPEQHFTQPPPRFSEASLVKEMEERGIGRPSTYASILATIQARDYVKKDEQNRLIPTQLGFLVTDLLVTSFPGILNVEFTAELENRLDSVEEGGRNWVHMLREFYTPFAETLEVAKKLMRDIKAEVIPTEHVCEKCSKPMIIKWGRMGEFLACSGYPECKNTKEFKRRDDGTVEIVEQEPTGEKCPTCSADMIRKRGRFGRFIACSRYPECKTTMAFTFGVHCPKCTVGLLGEKKSRRGRYFYGCTKYNKEGTGCDYVSWYKPLNEPCPQCNSPFLVEKWSKRTGAYKACPNKECGYKLIPEESQGDVPDMGNAVDI